MFKIVDEVENRSTAEISLTPYARIHRYGTPKIENNWILHEGLIGVIGAQGEQRSKYATALEEPPRTFDPATGGWLGFTDKYWASTVIPDQTAQYRARFSAQAPKLPSEQPSYQADYMRDTLKVAPGQTGSIQSQLFAGAKQMKILQAYQNSGIQQFDLLIDWGWFFFITKPLFQLMEAINSVVHNFGVTILILTVLVRLAFFPLASKQYASMAKMKKLQPQMEQLRERYKDDKVKQQQELMDLYKREKVNPVAGCVPILLQLPVFFALYKVLFITIDMRHAPFFGWIKDLSAPDPTSLFNLFGLLPYAVPEFLHVGVWPLIMGITMWLQMQLNPAAARSRAAADLQLDAGDVHVPAGVVPGRPRDLLGVEQHPVADAAVLHHETAGHRGSPRRQHLTQAQARGFDGRTRRRRHQAATRRDEDKDKPHVARRPRPRRQRT